MTDKFIDYEKLLKESFYQVITKIFKKIKTSKNVYSVKLFVDVEDKNLDIPFFLKHKRELWLEIDIVSNKSNIEIKNKNIYIDVYNKNKAYRAKIPYSSIGLFYDKNTNIKIDFDGIEDLFIGDDYDYLNDDVDMNSEDFFYEMYKMIYKTEEEEKQKTKNNLIFFNDLLTKKG